VLPGELPYFNKDLATGTWSGFSIEMANDIAKLLDVKLEFTESTYGNSILDLQANKVDLGFALNPTPQRALVVDFTKLKGTVISMKPAKNPKEVVLGLENPTVPEVTLKFETPLPGAVDAGTALEFSGIANGFTKDPFMVTFEVEKENLDGWTGKATSPTPKKSAPSTKKSAPAAKKK